MLTDRIAMDRCYVNVTQATTMTQLFFSGRRLVSTERNVRMQMVLCKLAGENWAISQWIQHHNCATIYSTRK